MTNPRGGSKGAGVPLPTTLSLAFDRPADNSHFNSNCSMKTPRCLLLISLAVVTLTSAAAEDSEPVKKDMTALQGQWSMVSGSADGQPMPEQMRTQMKRICKGDELTVTMGAQTFMKAKISINPSSKPKAIDYEMTEGVTKGKKQLGIYELDGDSFKSSFGAPGAERPTDFTSTAGDHRTVSVWKRQKEATAQPAQKN
jgi:uncharacterized protein (TIGR03067 family)